MFDAERFCGDFNIPYWTEGNNVSDGWVNITCPNCDDHSNHGGFNVSEGYYSCWRCGGHSTAYIIWLLTGRRDFRKIEKTYTTDTVVKSSQKREEARGGTLHAIGDTLQWYHRKYLQNRNFDPDYLVEKYKIRGTGISGELPMRIVIPIIWGGEEVSWQTRAIRETQLRYMTAPPDKEKIFHKSILYNFDNCREDSIVLTEGVFDVFRLGDNSCATFGTTFMPEQLIHLIGFKRIFLLFDPEEDAREKMIKAGNQLGISTDKVYIVDIPSGFDPADLSQDDADQLMHDLIGG